MLFLATTETFLFGFTADGYVLVTGSVIVLSLGIAKPLAGVVLNNASKTIQENGAMLVGMGLFVILNYGGQRFLAFK